MNNPLLVCQQLTKEYSEHKVFYDINLTIWPGEIISLVGPSGSGKTTLLRCLAGLDKVTQGKISLGGKDITSSRAEKLPIVMMFQQPLLFPHLTVLDNIVYGLQNRGFSKKERVAEGMRMLNKIDMENFSSYYPYQLSGGQQQRVSLARALVVKPQILLLDEPFASLDPELRGTIRTWVYSILKQEGVTALFVTHDKEEAMIMGDRIAVLKEGTIQQIGKPFEIYQNPRSKIVAEFFSEGLVLEDGFLPVDCLKLQSTKPSNNDMESLEGHIVSKWIKLGKFVYQVHLQDGKEINVTADIDFKLNQSVFLVFNRHDKKSFS